MIKINNPWTKIQIKDTFSLYMFAGMETRQTDNAHYINNISIANSTLRTRWLLVRTRAAANAEPRILKNKSKKVAKKWHARSTSNSIFRDVNLAITTAAVSWSKPWTNSCNSNILQCQHNSINAFAINPHKVH